MLKIENLIFSYTKDSLLKGVDLQVKKETIVAIVGPSASGKSTLFKLISGYYKPHQGVITVLGEGNLEKRRNHIAYMTQEDLLLPWKSIFDNLSIVFSLKKYSFFKKKENHMEILKIIEDVGLKGCESQLPGHLSGGMRQRASLARSLLFRRPLLLLDEPFGALDLIKKREMYQLLLSIKEKYRLTILFITHDLNDAAILANESYQLDQGRLKKIS